MDPKGTHDWEHELQTRRAVVPPISTRFAQQRIGRLFRDDYALDTYPAVRASIRFYLK